MVDPRVSSISVTDALGLAKPVLQSYANAIAEVTMLRLPVHADMDGGVGRLTERELKNFKDRKIMVIEMLRSYAMRCDMNTDKTYKEMVGDNCEKIEEGNFTVVKGFVLKILDTRMREADERDKVVNSPYDGGSV